MLKSNSELCRRLIETEKELSPPPVKGQDKLFRSPADVPIVHSLYQLYQSLHHLTLKFPKSQRYTLGSSLQTQLLTALELVISAASTNQLEIKYKYLQSASAKIDLLRLLIRLAKDCKCLSNQAYLELESQLHEAGRMLGGWLKSIK